MASLRLPSPLAAPPGDAAAPWVQLNRGLSQFFEGLEANAACRVGWFTPARAGQLAMLLQRGQTLLASPHWPRPEEARQRAVYAGHLRLLLGALQALESELSEVAGHLRTEQRHVDAVRSWLASQSASR